MDVRTLCLGTLCLQDATGYEIKKLFEAAFSHFQGASYGSIYPALRRLEADGLVVGATESGAGHPARRRFRVTDGGRGVFLEALAATRPAEHMKSEFLVLLFFAHLLPTGLLRERLAEAEAHFRDQLGYLDALLADACLTAGMRYTIEHGIRVYRAKLAQLEERREWLLGEHLALPGGSGACD